jgi:hypothetical protein
MTDSNSPVVPYVAGNLYLFSRAEKSNDSTAQLLSKWMRFVAEVTVTIPKTPNAQDTMDVTYGIFKDEVFGGEYWLCKWRLDVIAPQLTVTLTSKPMAGNDHIFYDTRMFFKDNVLSEATLVALSESCSATITRVEPYTIPYYHTGVVCVEIKPNEEML